MSLARRILLIVYVAFQRSVGTQTEHWMSARMSYELCVQQPEFQHFCGLSVEQFNHIYESLGNDAVFKYLKYKENQPTPKKERKKLLSLRCKLFLTLVRLRRAFKEKDLAYFMGVSLSTASRVCKTWIQTLFIQFSLLKPFMMPTVAQQQYSVPECFKYFKNVRVICDSFEVKCQRPSNFDQNANLYSDYKSACTCKFMVAVSKRGGIAFVSEAFEGSASDKEIFLKSGSVDFLEPGDAVMVDKGYLIEHEMNARHIIVYKPPLKKPHQQQATGLHTLRTRKIAQARIHVERIIGKIRRWNILNVVIPQTCLYLISQSAFVCSCLTNYEKVDL